MWESSVMASEYDEYHASINLVLDTNGYFTMEDDFPTGPEADEFSIWSELRHIVRFEGELIESAGRYFFTNDSIINLFFFTVRESYANVKKIKSSNDQVDITINVYGLDDSLKILSDQNLTIDYSYNNLPYNAIYDRRYPSMFKSLTTTSGTFTIKIPTGKHAGSLGISYSNYYSVTVDDFDTQKGFDYEIIAYLSKRSAANHHQYVHKIHGASAAKTGTKELTLTTVQPNRTFVLTKK